MRTINTSGAGRGPMLAPTVGREDRTRSPVGARARRALASAYLALDDVRVREHLRRAERDLRRSAPDSPTPEREARRQRNLDRLREYRRRGEFPRNPGYDGRVPCFVGADGTRCSVGHLLVEDGREDLVASVMADDPTLRIEDLEGGPVLEWIESNGFTREEAARIQPAYPQPVQFATTCGSVPCWFAAALASILAVAGFAAAEYVGYRVVDGLFPENTFKRRSALAYVTVANLFLAPLLGLLLYALFP